MAAQNDNFDPAALLAAAGIVPTSSDSHVVPVKLRPTIGRHHYNRLVDAHLASDEHAQFMDEIGKEHIIDMLRRR